MASSVINGTNAALNAEIEELRSKLTEMEQTLAAIRNGEVDAIVVSGKKGDQIFSLSSSETPYRIIIETMDEGAVTVSSGGLILYCNDRFSEIYSIPSQKLTGSDFTELVSEKDKKSLRKLLRASLKNPVRGEVESVVSGKHITLRLALTPLPDSMEGDICIVVSDITEIKTYQNYLQEIVSDRTKELSEANLLLKSDILRIKKAEKDLQLSEERYLLAVTAASIGTWEHIYTPRGWKLSWSDQMYKLFGLPPKGINRKKWISLIHPEDREKVMQELDAVLNLHTSYDTEYRIIRPDGSQRWIQCTGKITYFEEDNSTLRINGISRDVTERKTAEISLKVSEEKYRLLSDTMMQGVIYRDAEGRILSINPAGERIIGIKAEDVIGRKKVCDLFNEDGWEIPDSSHPALLALKTGLSSTDNIFRIFNTRENSFRWISMDTMPLFRHNQSRPYQVYSVFEDITGHRNAEKEILRREQLFRSAFDESAVSMSLTSREGAFLRVNHAFCILTGYSDDELRSMTFQDLTHPDDLERSLRGRDDLSTGEKLSVRIEKRYIRKDGRPIWVNISTAPVRDEKGNWDFFVTHIQDINKRKNAENRLRESRERFRQLANSIPQLACIARADGYVFWFNQRWYEFTGTKPEEVTGWGWQMVHDPAVAVSVMNSWKKEIAKGQAFEMTFPLRSADGSFREFLAKSIPIIDTDGNVEQWFTTHTDISELKKFENEIKRSQERLSIALENGQIGTWEWNIRTNEVMWDERSERMFMLEPGSFEGTLSAFESYIHEEDLPHFKKALHDALDEEKPFEAIYRTRPVNGYYNYISAKALLTRESDGQPTGMAGVFFDVTGMKKGAEHTLIRLNEELLRSNKELQQFAYVASHDLQEPLRMVSSFTQLLKLRYQDKLDADGQEFILYAVEGSKRMYDLLNGLLAFSRVQTRGKEFDLVDMNLIIAKVKQNLSLAISDNNAVIKSGKLPQISADESQMIQLVQNLFENGIKFRKGDPEISITCHSGADYHVFAVTDKGIGIEPQYYERIFKIFQRLHRSEEYEGTGIGLAICKRIVERHGGKIWVKSRPGRGSTFYFSVPKAIVNPEI